jgi:hypothetical protein
MSITIFNYESARRVSLVLQNRNVKSVLWVEQDRREETTTITRVLRCTEIIIQCVPLATEPGISLIILPLMRILQRNLKLTYTYTNTHERQPCFVGTLSQMTDRSAERVFRQKTGWLAGWLADRCSVSQQLGALQTHTTDTLLFISHTTNVPLFKFRCNILIGVRIIKEMLVSVASGTPCFNIMWYQSLLILALFEQDAMFKYRDYTKDWNMDYPNSILARVRTISSLPQQLLPLGSTVPFLQLAPLLSGPSNAKG